MSAEEEPCKAGIRRPLVEALIGYGTYCTLGLISRFIPLVFLFFVAFGIFFPLAWAKATRSWGELGFSRRNLGPALAWGAGAGLLWAGYSCLFFREEGPLPPLLGLQLAAAVPLWLLIMSPFQEFFFRGWLQPRVQAVAGDWAGLVITALLFTAWHFFPQFEGTATADLPLDTPLGLASMIGLGLMCGYLFLRTGSIVSPWLAHAIGGLAMVLLGRMSFIQVVP